jgi:hypothetical protein
MGHMTRSYPRFTIILITLSVFSDYICDIENMCFTENNIYTSWQWYFVITACNGYFESVIICYRTMRYTAYRQVIRWCYGWLGKHNRKPLPSCTVHRIRERFQAGPKGYKGFTFMDRNWHGDFLQELVSLLQQLHIITTFSSLIPLCVRAWVL